MLLSEDTSAERFRPVAINRPVPLYGVAPAGGSAVVAVGAGGVLQIQLGHKAKQELH
ncbi:hypothetical protein D3C78_1811130 [compost metagenome]